ncbi:MAG TPA: O-antigen ligase family protein [Solirubrobacteraceae bacterium]
MAAPIKTRAMALRPARPTTGAALLVALLVAAGYAAFAEGAVGQPEEAWLQVAVAFCAVVAAAAWLGAGRLRSAPGGVAIAGVVLLALYAAWAAISLAWTVAPDRTWAEFNRGLAYALVVAVALLAAGQVPRAIERVAMGWLAIAVSVAVYALGGKVLPGVLDHAEAVARLRAPLEYWNALGLVCVLGVPVALRVATERTRTPVARCGGLLATMLLLTCLGLTYSRGGLVALAVVVVVLTVLGGARLRGLVAIAVAAVAAAPALAFAWTDDRLAENFVAHGERVDAGLVLGALLLAGTAAVFAGGLALIRLEARGRWSRGRSQVAWFALAAIGVALVAAGLTAMATSSRGFEGSIEEAVDNFTEVRRDEVYEPDRLLSTTSANRWAWWREAFGAYADEPVLGWGAGSFPVSRRLYRATPYDVQQTHSLPLQLMAETGTVGLVLAGGGLLLLFAAALARVRGMRAPPGPGDERERDLAVALFAAAAGWLVHALADWDWDIPGVTVPVLLFLGVLAARPPRVRPAAALSEPSAARWLALGAGCLLLAAFAVSAVLPAWSSSRTDSALRAVEERTPERLEDGARDAELAADLDPLAVRPLFAAASIAEARGRTLEARAHLLEAVERAPWSAEAWRRLTRLALGLADREGARRAAARLLELDPGNPRVLDFVREAQGLATPPEGSATAGGTPLTP